MRKTLSHILHLLRRSNLGSQPVKCSYQVCRYLSAKSKYADSSHPREWEQKIQLPTPELNWNYLLDDKNISEIEENIQNRKGVGNIHKVRALWKNVQEESEPEKKASLQKELLEEAINIPNSSSPHSPIGDESNAKVLEIIGEEKEFPDEQDPKKRAKTGNEIAEKMRFVGDSTNLVTGIRTLHFHGDLAKLEQALIKYTLSRLISKGFTLLSVPDMINPAIVERCGFPTTGERTQVFKLKADYHGDICFAGTAEMPLAGYFMNEVMPFEELPTRVCAVSRCYRAETSDNQREKGLYRTKIFTKVEMFGVTANETGNEGEELLQEFLNIQKELFRGLDLRFRILDMPTNELGAPAYRKFDIETLMHASQWWGEISSASNCTDYQSRRLNIKYRNQDGNLKHVSTVNATACAVPRLAMAILEQYQAVGGGRVRVPAVLLSYMDMPGGRLDMTAAQKHSLFIKGSKFVRKQDKDVKES